MTEWKLVPVEPTQAMVIAGAAIWGFDDEKAVPVYKAMLAASLGPLWTPAKINPDTWIGTDESGQMVDFLDGKKGAEIERLRDKALAYDLDQAGIERRAAEAVELVEARAEIARLLAENERLTNILYHNGFRSCDIAECNCGSWHQIGGFAARFREIEDATADEWRNGETLLTRIERIMLDLQALRGEGE
jgi:hypothetical protein